MPTIRKMVNNCLISFSPIKKPRILLGMSNFHFHFLFRCSITVPNNSHHTSKLHHFPKGSWHYRWVVQLEWYRPRNMKCGCQFSQNHVTKNFGTIVIILIGVFHKTEAIYIADVRLAVSSVK